ncbi:hypothetical protein CN390_17175, partial [Bacillus cereus]
KNLGLFFVLVVFILLKLMGMGSYHIAIKLRLCKVNFRRDCFFFIRGKCIYIEKFNTKLTKNDSKNESNTY